VSVKEPLIDLSQVDFNHVIADIETIRRYNPQRFEMEQLTAIVYEDTEQDICVGYKDISREEFWVRGHMPGMPLMPGVVICEAAAQLCSYYTQRHDLLKTKMIGFGGMEEVRFRDPVIPGDRLVLVCKLIKVRAGRMLVAACQGFVREKLVFDGQIKGVPIPTELLGGLEGAPA